MMIKNSGTTHRISSCIMGLGLMLAVPSISYAELEIKTGLQTTLTHHGTAKYGQPGKPFLHFDYANPNAPKGGKLRMAASGTFDSLNSYSSKGTAVTGLNLIYDTLMTQSNDEAFSMYPLVAESAEIAPDKMSIQFNLNPEARFHDGKSITAEDVSYTFKLLIEKGHPFFGSYYSDIESVKALNKGQVLFSFKSDQNPELPFIMSQLPILPKHYWEKPENDFSSASLTPPLGSGPYKISQVDGGRSISYQRVADYWGKDLPVNKGRYNFDEVIYDYYRDEHVALQGLKAGAYDLRYETVAKNWATAYDVPAVHNGDLVLSTLPTISPAPIQGFAYNLRRDQFQDRKVRKAISYAMDFEWLNRNLFYNSYIRSSSYFNNSGMEAKGMPNEDELALLAPWKKQLPEDLFTKPYELPVSDGSGNIRSNLKTALSLLKDAGWTLDNGQLTNSKGERFSIELLIAQPSMERVALPFKKNLEQIGISLNIRTVDTSQYIQRLRDFDYDMIVVGYGQSASPGNEQSEFWGSTAADTKGSRNYMGIKDPVVDAMIGHVINAHSRQELTTAVKALDRVLLWGEYLIPQWYYPYDRIAHSSKVVRPDAEPLYNTDLYTWWIEEANASEPSRKASTPVQSPVDDEQSNKWLYSGLVLLGLIPLWMHRRRKRTSPID
ncbi:extracellular solute-binding protein [Endozoicomonas ascidiicola]|uniref:extracellular solute-binding protein n=1 Tax=Endozoicomonas ascidiicola TaxID=1698521 RepID=UPI000829D7B2|nr:extracellular solute-binding protein [Endozoicomonas ascidiicola]